MQEMSERQKQNWEEQKTKHKVGNKESYEEKNMEVIWSREKKGLEVLRIKLNLVQCVNTPFENL